jgi:hypothetical protein
MNDTQSRLTDMMKANVGDPPGRVTVRAVRRQRARRHVRMAGLVTAVAVIAAISASAGFRLTTSGPAAGGAAGPQGVPRYYAEQTFRQGNGSAVIRATATGDITAHFRCPWPKNASGAYPMAADAHRGFFMVCQKSLGDGSGEVRIYRFHLTATGKVAGYAKVSGGDLGSAYVTRMVVSPDGSRIAVLDSPSSSGRAAAGTVRGRIIVIDTRTGTQAVWRNAAPGTGATRFYLLDLSFGLDGREVLFGGDTACGSGPNPPRCRPFDQQIRVLTPAATGGLLSEGRIILRVTQHGHVYIGPAVLSDDGSSLTYVNELIPFRKQPSWAQVIQVALRSGKQHVIYQFHGAKGSQPVMGFSSDASGRHFLITTGQTGHTVTGRLAHGKLIELKPVGKGAYDAW